MSTVNLTPPASPTFVQIQIQPEQTNKDRNSTSTVTSSPSYSGSTGSSSRRSSSAVKTPAKETSSKTDRCCTGCKNPFSKIAECYNRISCLNCGISSNPPDRDCQKTAKKVVSVLIGLGAIGFILYLIINAGIKSSEGQSSQIGGH